MFLFVIAHAQERPSALATAVPAAIPQEPGKMAVQPSAGNVVPEAVLQEQPAPVPPAPAAPVPVPPAFSIQADTSAVKSIRIFWSKSFEGEEYNVLKRISSSDIVKLNSEPLKVTEYADSDISSLTAYTYKVERLTEEKNEYSQELTVTAPGIMAPLLPASFRGYQDIESAMLKWTPAPKTSFEIAGYRIMRGKTRSSFETLTVTAAAAIRYEDFDVEPAVKYFYKLRTVDKEGNESPESGIEEIVPFPPARTNLILMPTAYRNDIFDNYGFNADMRFSYYIGTIAGANSYIDNVADAKDYFFSKIGLWLLTADVKGSLFNESEAWPSVAVGMTYTLLLQDKLGSSGATGGSAALSPKDQITQMYAPYIAVSKKALWDTYFTAGYMLGAVHDRVPTLFMSYLKDDILTTNPDATGVYVKNSASTYYLGFSRKLFDRVGVRIEYIVPVDANRNALFPDYYLINTHFDRFVNFDIGYFHYPGGYSIVGYFSFRFSVYPNPYK